MRIPMQLGGTGAESVGGILTVPIMGALTSLVPITGYLGQLTGILFSDVKGRQLPWPSRVVMIAAELGATSTGTIGVYANGVLVVGASMAMSGLDSRAVDLYSAVIPAGHVIAPRVVSGNVGLSINMTALLRKVEV